MAILPVLDLAHPGGPLLATVDPAHALSGLFGLVLMGIAMAALFHRAERHFSFALPASALLFSTYALALWLLYSRVASG
jgi:cation:H+ antiporter